MTRFTLVMAYYENSGMLRRQYDHLKNLPEDLRDRMSLIIVDDGSPAHPAWGEEIGMPLDVFRIGVDVRWNQDAARNIGVHEAKTSWLLLTDMDHMVPLATAEFVTNTRLDGHTVYRFSRVSEPDLAPYKPHPNSWLITKAEYDKVGGYDERFAGYYGTDADFRNRLAASVGGAILQLAQVLIRVPRTVTPDASTTTYGRKEPIDLILKKLIAERSALPQWTTKRLTFPYTLVWRRS